MDSHSITRKPQIKTIVTLAAASLLAACGGSSGGATDDASDAGSFESRSNVVEGPLDPLQDELITNVVGGMLGTSLPSPLGTTVSCLSDSLNSLIDGPDALLAALSDLPNGTDPAAAFQSAGADLTGSLQRFADELQSSLMALGGQGGCETVASGGNPEPASTNSNPLAGTPLEAIGDALAPLADALGGFSTAGEDPDLTVVAATVQPLLQQLAGSFDQVPAEVKDAPVVGGLLMTLQSALADVHDVLPAIGAYDAINTQSGVADLLNNVLSNVLIRTVPVEQLDDATGQDVSAQVQAAIDQLTGTLGPVVGQAISPAFDQLLNGALEPALDPIEALLSQILSGAGGGELPLSGLLASLRPGE